MTPGLMDEGSEWQTSVGILMLCKTVGQRVESLNRTEDEIVGGDSKSGEKKKEAFGLSDFLVRLAAALLLVLITYNPAGWSYAHWVKNAFADFGLGPVHFLAGAILIAGWAIFIVATRGALGTLGLIIVAAILAALVWLFVDLGWLGFDSVAVVSWVLLICISIVLAVGLSWAHIWRRMSGQLEIADDDQ
jgi:hypothetical protein